MKYSLTRLPRRKRPEDQTVDELLRDLRKIKESNDKHVGGAASDGYTSPHDWTKDVPPGFGAP